MLDGDFEHQFSWGWGTRRCNIGTADHMLAIQPRGFIKKLYKVQAPLCLTCYGECDMSAYAANSSPLRQDRFLQLTNVIDGS